MRLLLDEMYPPQGAELLRARGIDAISVKEHPELVGLGDEAILAVAVLDRRVLVTENVSDFALLSRSVDHVGIVFCHPRRFPRERSHLQRLVQSIAALDALAPEGLGHQAMQWWLT